MGSTMYQTQGSVNQPDSNGIYKQPIQYFQNQPPYSASKAKHSNYMLATNNPPWSSYTPSKNYGAVNSS